MGWRLGESDEALAMALGVERLTWDIVEAIIMF